MNQSSAGKNSVAFSAVHSSLGASVCVGRSVFMAARAMRNRLSEWQRALNVHFASNRLQVIRIYATSNTASMVQLQTGWDLTFCKFERNDVSGSAMGARYGNLSVSLGSDVPSPKPASGIRFWTDEAHQSINDWYSGLCHVISFQIASVRAAQCFSIDAAHSYYSPGVGH